MYSKYTKDILFHIYEVLHTHIKIYCYSTFDLNYISFHQIYIYIIMVGLLLKVLIHFSCNYINNMHIQIFFLFRTHALLDKDS